MVDSLNLHKLDTIISMGILFPVIVDFLLLVLLVIFFTARLCSSAAYLSKTAEEG